MNFLQTFLSDQPHARDLYLVVYAAAAFVILRFFCDIFIFEKLAIWCLNSEAGSFTKLSKDANLSKISKFKESLWKLSCYTAWEFSVYKISKMEPWFYNTEVYFEGWPHQPMKLPLKLYYTSQCGFYMYSIMALLVWETRRKDFGVMLAHHIITLSLISYSYITRFFRIGVMTLALHDMSDLIMELAKLCKYSGKELSASICFGVFALSWFFLRLIYFPFWVIHSSSYWAVKALDVTKAYHKFIYYIFNTMLINLLMFHLYWWILICRMVKRQMQNKGQVGEDIRSDDEEEDE